MKLLILLEDEKYLPIVAKITEGRNAKVEVSNIDFNITNSIKRAEAILFLGETAAYKIFCSEYQQLLATKLVFTTARRLMVSDFEIESMIKNGVIVCRVPFYTMEIRSVIIEAASNIFDNCLKQLIVDEDGYIQTVEEINNFERALTDLAEAGLEVLPSHIILQIISTFTIKNT